MNRLFAQWPTAIPREGSVVTAFGETIPFEDFMLTNELVLLLRPQPDGMGTRRVIMKVADVVGIRIANSIEPERFMAMGFQKHAVPLARRSG
ncbi:MAG: hypothetical protein R3C49_18620 [Planctomycetaceae bacterium]